MPAQVLEDISAAGNGQGLQRFRLAFHAAFGLDHAAHVVFERHGARDVFREPGERAQQTLMPAVGSGGLESEISVLTFEISDLRFEISPSVFLSCAYSAKMGRATSAASEPCAFARKTSTASFTSSGFERSDFGSELSDCAPTFSSNGRASRER